MSDRYRLIYRSCFSRILLGGLAFLSIGTLSHAQTDGPLRVHSDAAVVFRFASAPDHGRTAKAPTLNLDTDILGGGGSFAIMFSSRFLGIVM